MHPSFECGKVHRHAAQLTGFGLDQLPAAQARLVQLLANQEVGPIGQIFSQNMWKEEFSHYHMRLYLAAYFREVFMRTDRKDLKQKYERIGTINSFIRTILPHVTHVTGPLPIEQEINEQESGGPMSRRGTMLIPTTETTEPKEVLLRQEN